MSKDVTKYTIRPYEAVNGFSFYSSVQDIEKKEGKPFTRTEDFIMERVVESRAACELVYEENKLVEITLNQHTCPMIDGIEVFTDKGVEQLKSLDPEWIEGMRYMLFPKWGLFLGGFSKKKAQEGKILIAFCKEQLETFRFMVTDD